VADQAQRLILLAALSQLLVQEIERSDKQELATDGLKAELRAFASRVEAELDATAGRKRLRLADPE
jgi:hypothetical protein